MVCIDGKLPAFEVIPEVALQPFNATYTSLEVPDSILNYHLLMFTMAAQPINPT